MRGNGNAVFGPVSTIDTAPVSMGNSIHGSEPMVRHTPSGVRVQGRDFMLQLATVTSAVTNWVMVGGCPLIPHAFVASALRSFSGMYAEFVVHGLTFHFITSSATSNNGNVMFYVNKDRGNALLDTSNANFMSVVLSDPHTTIGPLWRNTTATYQPAIRAYSTNILNDEDLTHSGPGELVLYTRNTAGATNSPGYVLIDYDISFNILQTSPRLLTFPMSRLKYAQYGLGYSVDVTVVLGAEAVVRTNTVLLDGTTSVITNDPAAKLGDVYKVVMLPQFGVYSGLFTPNTILESGARQGAETSVVGIPQVIDDGFTCFGVFMASVNGILMLYPTMTAAMSQSNPYKWGISTTGQFQIPSWLSLVGNVVGGVYQSNY